MAQHDKWLATFWRWLYEALDRKDFDLAFVLGDCINRMMRRR